MSCLGDTTATLRLRAKARAASPPGSALVIGTLALALSARDGEAWPVLAIDAELRTLTAKLLAENVPYALCGALALAVHGHPRATLDIDLLALSGSGERIRQCARTCGFTLEAAPMQFVGGAVRIQRLSKAVARSEDVLMLDVLSLSAEIEREMSVETFEWQGAPLRTVSRESLARLKRLRGSAQDMADLEKLR